MKKNRQNQKPMLLKPGYCKKETYHDYYTLEATSSDNWGHNCTYQLLPDALTGEHRVIQLYTMQLSYGKRPGGMMNNVYSAEDSISIAVMQKVTDKACFAKLKLKTGDIFLFDDTHTFNFLSNSSIEFAVVSIEKSTLGKSLPLFLEVLQHRIKDTDHRFSDLLEEVWTMISLNNARERYEEIEERILSFMEEMLERETLIPSKLTRGEEISLVIRDQIYAHMDGKVNIAALAKEHQVSEKTLQNSFKSLFGFTPKLFMRQLKLNLVHYELRKANHLHTTVSQIAQKWGFTHMGRFSIYYKALFGENPSMTLKDTTLSKQEGLVSNCVLRQEEML